MLLQNANVFPRQTRDDAVCESKTEKQENMLSGLQSECVRYIGDQNHEIKPVHSLSKRPDGICATCRVVQIHAAVYRTGKSVDFHVCRLSKRRGKFQLALKG